jgi:hypothetical protein
MSDYDDLRAHSLPAEHHAILGGRSCRSSSSRSPRTCRPSPSRPRAPGLRNAAPGGAPSVRTFEAESQLGVSGEALAWRRYNLVFGRGATTPIVPGLDWDRESREARKRRHGSIPAWADPSALSLSDERRIQSLLRPMTDLLSEYELLSRTQRDQRCSEFTYRLSKLESAATSDSASFENISARDEVRRRAAGILERLRGNSR